MSCAKAMPDVGTPTARLPPWAANAAAASGSWSRPARRTEPVPQAESAPKPTTTNDRAGEQDQGGQERAELDEFRVEHTEELTVPDRCWWRRRSRGPAGAACAPRRDGLGSRVVELMA